MSGKTAGLVEEVSVCVRFLSRISPVLATVASNAPFSCELCANVFASAGVRVLARGLCVVAMTAHRKPGSTGGQGGLHGSLHIVRLEKPGGGVITQEPRTRIHSKRVRRTQKPSFVD